MYLYVYGSIWTLLNYFLFNYKYIYIYNKLQIKYCIRNNA